MAMPEDSQPGMVGDKIKGSWDAEAESSFCLFVIIFENGCLVAQARTSCVVEDNPELVSVFHWMRKEDGNIGRLF